MLTIYLEKGTKNPLYVQLYIQIREAILSGKMFPGEKLPSKRKLADDLEISIQTIENAYGQLVAEGYVSAKPKSGYFVEDVSMPFHYETEEKKERTRYADSENVNKISKYDFSTNIVDETSFPYDEWAKEYRNVLTDFISFDINSSSLAGLDSLRNEIAGYLYRYRGISASPSNIIIGSGTEYSIMLIKLLFGTNVKIGVENPGYPKLLQMYAAMGIEAIPIDLDESGIRVADLEISGANLVHVTPSHQFPSGLVMPAKRRSSLLEWAEKHEERYIIEDDYDSEFRFSGAPIRAMKSLDLHDRVIYVNSFAKSEFPGLRVNYMVFPDNLIKRLKSEFSYVSCPVAVFSQQALANNIKSGRFERHLAKMKKIYKMRRNALITAIMNSNLSKIFVIKGEEAGLHFLLVAKADLNEKKLMETAKEAGILLHGLSEYCLKKIDMPATLVMGYSKIVQNQAKDAVTALINSFSQFIVI